VAKNAPKGTYTTTVTTRQSGSWCALAAVTDAGYTTGSNSTTFST
jgi:hypothetical protein